MTYATLMVHLDLGRKNQSILELTGELAGQFGARVIGVAAGELNQSAYFMAGRFADDLIVESRAGLKKQILDLEQEFRSAMKGQAKTIQWRGTIAFPTEYLVQQSRAADLVIVGSAQEGQDSWSRLEPAQLLMAAGRPVLVVPPEQRWLSMRSILVAWKDTRESRRAIVDALPLLRSAKDVTVLEVPEDEEKDRAQIQIDEVIVWLASHDVTASRVVGNGHDAADKQIDRVASNVGATLIVAGAYGHARLREWAFGGVTKALLSQSRYPILMSH